MKKRKTKLFKITIVTIFVAFFLIIYTSPVVFMRDGMLTKMKVDDFNQQYNLGRTNRHNGELRNIYMFYAGIKQPEVFKESRYEDRYVEKKVFLKKIAPCVYKWKSDFNTSAYRILVGDYKYYCTVVTN